MNKVKTILLVDSDVARLCKAVNLLSQWEDEEIKKLHLVIAVSKSEGIRLLKLHNDQMRSTGCRHIDAIVSHLNIIDGEEHEESNRVGESPLGLCLVAEAIKHQLPFILYSHKSWNGGKPRGVIHLFNALKLGEHLEFADPDVERSKRDIQWVFFRVFQKLLKNSPVEVEQLSEETVKTS